MRPASTIATYCLLALAGGTCMMLPERVTLSPTWASASAEPSSVRLAGSARLLGGEHPDFPDGGVRPTGLHAGLVAETLDETGVPRFTGPADGVREPARDRLNRPIATHLAFRCDGGGSRLLFVTRRSDDWTIGELVKKFLFESWGYEVTSLPGDAKPSEFREALEAHDVVFIGEDAEAEALRNKFDYPLRTAAIGIVNENRGIVGCDGSASGAGLGIVRPEACASSDFATTHLRIAGLQHWTTAPLPPGEVAVFASPQRMYAFDAEAVAVGATVVGRHVTEGRPQLLVVDRGATLADGDASAGRRVHLPFVGWSDNLTVVTPDGQQLVRQLVDWAAGKDGDRLGDPLGTPARLTGSSGAAGIASAESFGTWFVDGDDVGRPIPHALSLVRQPDGVYVFDDALDAGYRSAGGYRPGLEGATAPSDAAVPEDAFTATFVTHFTHRARRQAFVQVSSNADVWIYVDGRLAIDLGGVHPTMTQRVDLARLDLEEGRRCELHVFIAHRGEGRCRLRIETDLVLTGVPTPGS